MDKNKVSTILPPCHQTSEINNSDSMSWILQCLVIHNMIMNYNFKMLSVLIIINCKRLEMKENRLCFFT